MIITKINSNNAGGSKPVPVLADMITISNIDAANVVLNIYNSVTGDVDVRTLADTTVDFTNNYVKNKGVKDTEGIVYTVTGTKNNDNIELGDGNYKVIAFEGDDTITVFIINFLHII